MTKELLGSFLRDKGTEMVYKRNDAVFRQGQSADYLYWLIEGEGKWIKNVHPDEEQILAFVHPERLFGLPAIVNDRPYISSLIIVSPKARVIRVDKQDFHDLVQQKPQVVLRLLGFLEKEIVGMQTRATRMVRRTTEQRLARALLDLSAREHIPTLNLRERSTPADLARYIGTTRTTVYRLLKKFQEDHLIEIEGRDLHLVNTPQLEEIAG
ncbi:MAG: Crp/Fnr family transcriptional regulator [Bacteroidota bacterium]|nr:Crp/Fnr family transcriptional regulator [Bacteroidota bacterium]